MGVGITITGMRIGIVSDDMNSNWNEPGKVPQAFSVDNCDTQWLFKEV